VESETLDGEFIRREVLPQFGLPASSAVAVTRIAGGLINRTFLVNIPAWAAGEPTDFVLQQVNPVFHRAIHGNIAAVTRALHRAGVLSPHLIPTADGQLCVQLSRGAEDRVPTVWRLMNFIAGSSFDVVLDRDQAFAAGALVARFHAALEGLDHEFVGRRAGVHDVARHLEALAHAIATHPSHRLFAPVQSLADEIFSAAHCLPALPDLPEQICHGDLKFSNFLFAGREPPQSARALCLVDLDTVGPMALAHELGDAWRSWCNRSGEDEPEATLDLDLFAASWEGYRHSCGRSLSALERQALLLGPEWISLELSARFAADALAETYFGWDARRFPARGEHNLTRAQGQYSLHRAFHQTRPHRSQTLAS
jgi:Ser/Thr protein kinase RdoA (MazF antagonist)